MFGDNLRPFAVHAGLLRGLNFLLDPRIDTQQLTGLYELEIAAAVRRLSAHARAAVDVGANDGFYTLYFAAQPRIARVVACEPDKSHLQRLESNLALNRKVMTDKVSVNPVAVGSDRSAGLRPLDELLEGCPEPILLKVDVEGAEMDVLNSGKRGLTSRKLMLILETHSASLERQCIEFLEGMGFRCSIRKQGWYRVFVPELRQLPHNRWLIAERSGTL